MCQMDGERDYDDSAPSRSSCCHALPLNPATDGVWLDPCPSADSLRAVLVLYATRLTSKPRRRRRRWRGFFR
jgi:hypothetical protein